MTSRRTGQACEGRYGGASTGTAKPGDAQSSLQRIVRAAHWPHRVPFRCRLISHSLLTFCPQLVGTGSDEAERRHASSIAKHSLKYSVPLLRSTYKPAPLHYRFVILSSNTWYLTRISQPLKRPKLVDEDRDEPRCASPPSRAELYYASHPTLWRASSGDSSNNNQLIRRKKKKSRASPVT